MRASESVQKGNPAKREKLQTLLLSARAVVGHNITIYHTVLIIFI